MQQAALDLPGVEPDPQSVTILEHQGQTFDSGLVRRVVAEEHVELVRHRNGGRQEGLVVPALVEVGQEPVAQFDGARARAEFEPPGRIRQERRPALPTGLANGETLDDLTVEPLVKDPGRLDMHGVPHRDDVAHARLDEPGRDGAKHGHLAERAAAAGLKNDERDAVSGENLPDPIGADKVGPGLGQRVRAPRSKQSAPILEVLDERPVAFEVDDIVGILAAIGFGEHFLKPGQRRRPDEVHGGVVSERLEGVQERGRG